MVSYSTCAGNVARNAIAYVLTLVAAEVYCDLTVNVTFMNIAFKTPLLTNLIKVRFDFIYSCVVK